MSEYSKELCDEKHRQLEDKIGTHEKRLNNHSERIDQLEQNEVGNTKDIANLCKRLDDMISQNRWFIGILIVQLIGFFFFAIQKTVFK